MSLGEYEEAIAQLTTAIQARFKEAEALANRGLARYLHWSQQGRPQASRESELGLARADLQTAIQLKPRLNSDLMAAYVNLANVYRDLGQAYDASQLEIWTDLLPLVPMDTDPQIAYQARLRRGQIYLKQNNYTAAAQDFAEATSLFSDRAAAFYYLGLALLGQGQPEKASWAFHQAIKADPAHVAAQQALGEIALQSGRYQEAERAFGAALRAGRQSQDPVGQAAAHLGLGQLYLSMPDRRADAERELKQAMSLAEQASADLIYTRAAYQLGLVHLQAGEADQAVALLSNAAPLFEVLGEPLASIEANLELGRAYLAQDDKPAAQQALEKAGQQLAAIFDPEKPEHEALQTAIQEELERCQ
jgi:tetratricopeptide (TPR) repeat protein